MIEYPGLNFSKVSDPIKTEETIYNKIKNINFNIEYVGLPLAHSINTLGLEKTQSIINEINTKNPNEKFFVCQHIHVKKLDFGNNLIFTPHTEESDRFHFIPHYNPIYNEVPKRLKFSDRSFKFSFVGDLGTNKIRDSLTFLNTEKTPIIPTGMWFFSHDKEKQQNLLKIYIDILTKSKISLCPMGTGPSTLRLFESMSVGSIPVIFNKLKLPDEIKKMVKIIRIDEIIKSPDLLDDLAENGENLSKNIYELYWDCLSNEHLHEYIIKFLNKN
jgi:hypothetical protein